MIEIIKTSVTMIPGSFVKTRNSYGKSLLAINEQNLYLMGDGLRDDGQFPFIDQI